MFFLKQLPSRETLERYHERFPQMNVDNVEAALHMLKRASLLLRRLDSYFAAEGLSFTRYLTLIIFDREAEPVAFKMTEIADRLDVSKPVMTRTLKTMVEDGYLVVDVDKADERAKQFRLTPRGKAKLDAVLPGYYRTIDRFMSELENENQTGQ